MAYHELSTARKFCRSQEVIQRKEQLQADPRLLLWRRMIEFSVAEAKKTLDGLPTDLAILARWWVAEFQPKETDKDEWERSFECACHWLELDVVKERRRLVMEIDAALLTSCVAVMHADLYRRRAMVLSCAGVTTAIARQFVLPLVAPMTYDDVAGVETMDIFPIDIDTHKPDEASKRCDGRPTKWSGPNARGRIRHNPQA
jgi:hypothetical protein